MYEYVHVCVCVSTITEKYLSKIDVKRQEYVLRYPWKGLDFCDIWLFESYCNIVR